MSSYFHFLLNIAFGGEPVSQESLLGGSILGKKHFFVNSETLGIQIWRKNSVKDKKNLIRQNSVDQIINTNAFFLPYFHAICVVFTYLTSFTGYTDDIFRVISYLYVQGPKIGRKMEQSGGKSKKKLNSA